MPATDLDVASRNLETVKAAMDCVLAIEIVDSRIADWDITMPTSEYTP